MVQNRAHSISTVATNYLSNYSQNSEYENQPLNLLILDTLSNIVTILNYKF